jgi:hypothetical protein
VRRTSLRITAAIVAVVPFALLPPASPAQAAECLPAAQTPYPAVPWAQEQLAPQRAWPLSRGDGVVVAVIDTGVSATALALAGRVLPGRDIRAGGTANTDCAGHGTFVAGLIAAGAMAGTGFSGVAPGAVILPVRVADTFDDQHPDVLALGIDAAIDGGASIIVVVPAAPFGSATLANAIARAERENRVVIASSTTNRAGGEAHPAAYESVLSVAGIERDGSPMSFLGLDGTGRIPDLAGPATDLVGVAPAGAGNLIGSARCFATGFVAGAAALIRGYLTGLTAAQVRERLVATADPAPPSARPALGRGMVDPVAAVTTVDPAGPSESGPPVIAPEPALPYALRDGHRDGLALAGNLVVAIAMVAIVAGLAATAAVAARRRRTDAGG